MSLKQMMDFKPRDDEMLSLPLDVVLYIKVTIVSYSKEDNYNYIRYLFTNEEAKTYFKDYDKTLFYDFDGTDTTQSRFITVFELYSLMNYSSTSIYLEELQNKYSHETDVIIDIFTHDNKVYRLADVDGVVSLDELKNV